MELIEMTNGYIKQTGTTIADLAKDINVSRSTLSRFLNGNYKATPQMMSALYNYLSEKGYIVDDSEEEKEEIAMPETTTKQLVKKNEFYVSRDASSIMGLCSSCQKEASLGIVTGRSGFGKTYALKQYAKLPKVAYIECDDTMGQRDLIRAIESKLGLPNSYGSVWERINRIREFCDANKGYLLIIDEADKLVSKYTQKKLEILRGIFDQSSVGIVIAGEPKLEILIKNYIDRFANRIDFYHQLSGLTKKEVEDYLKDYPITAEAMIELKNRATNPTNGCFRLLDRTMNNVFRIVEENEAQEITLNIINQASSMMML